MNSHEIGMSEAAEAGRYDALDNVTLAAQAWRTVENAVGRYKSGKFHVPQEYWAKRRETESEVRAAYGLGTQPA